MAVGVTVHVVPDAGHTMAYDNPTGYAEAIAAAIISTARPSEVPDGRQPQRTATFHAQRLIARFDRQERQLHGPFRGRWQFSQAPVHGMPGNIVLSQRVGRDELHAARQVGHQLHVPRGRRAGVGDLQGIGCLPLQES